MYNEEIFEHLKKLDAYSDQDLVNFIQFSTSKGVNWGPLDWGDVLEIRASVELIRAIRRFDAASGRLVKTTNRLTWIVIFLGVVAIVIPLAPLVIAWFRH
jgi:hypothetical protein